MALSLDWAWYRLRNRRVALRLQHLDRALHRFGRLRSDLGSGRRPLRMAGVPDAAPARLGFRAVLPAFERFHHAGVSRTALQSELRHLSREHLRHRLYLYEDLGAFVRGC